MNCLQFAAAVCIMCSLVVKLHSYVQKCVVMQQLLGHRSDARVQDVRLYLNERRAGIEQRAGKEKVAFKSTYIDG